jgi:biotin carboxylase
MKILLLAAGSKIAYKVLRCAAEAGGAVFVLGDQKVSRLATSRYCSSFLQSPHPIHRVNAEALAVEINRIVAERGISAVVPGDYESTYILAAMRQKIQTRVFPLPSSSVLEELNNKWSFHNLCQSFAIPAPASSLVSDRSELARVLSTPSPPAGRIAKPIDREGSAGFVELAAQTVDASLEQIDYQPVLIQDYVAGRDICISLFCQNGEVRASVAYTHGDHTVTFTRHAELERCAGMIADHFKYTGVLCFDGRLGPGGGVSFIECNPRFWNNMDAAMIGGINFVALGLAEEPPADFATIESGVTLRKIAFSLPALLRPWRFSKLDFRFLLYRLRDFRFMLGGPRTGLGART